MTTSTETTLYQRYTEARETTWKVYELLVRYGKIHGKQDLYTHPAYIKALEKEKAAYSAYLASDEE